MPPRVAEKKVPHYNFFKAIGGNIAAIIVGVKYFFDPNRFTLMYPREYIKLDKRYRGFIVLIKDKCIGCDSCARVCPAKAMKMIKITEPDKKRPGKTKLAKYPVINYQRCIFCGFCVDICPTEALVHLPVHDVVYYNLAEMELNLDEFQKELRSPAEMEGVPVKYVFDPDRGLVKVKETSGE